jgi:type II secretory pathway pseudopilin PulG
MGEMKFTGSSIPWFRRVSQVDDCGFSLVEFVISSAILLVICASVFSVLAETQRSASYQSEVQSVLENTYMALETVERFIRQAGNDPIGTGLAGLTIVSSSEIRLRSDLTGSDGTDKGDPDGDTADSGEDVTIRYDGSVRSLELVHHPGSAQAVADYVSAFSMQYYDAAGAVTTSGPDVRRIRIDITGATTLANPRTGETFSLRLTSDVQLATRL